MVVYIVLGVLYESFIHPITILSTLPSAGVGALLALQVFHLDLDIVAIIGIILLIGIVKKNGIMMVDFALEAGARHEGCNSTEAIYQASLLRFRPILMTTMAALLGGHSTGVRLRHWIGAAASAGCGAWLAACLLSQVLTLYTTPVIYIFFDNRERGLRAGGEQDHDCAARRRGRMNPSRIFIERPVATTLLTIAVAIAGIIAFTVLPVSPAAASGLPGDHGGRAVARREPGHHGVLRGDAAGAPVRAHRRRE